MATNVNLTEEDIKLVYDLISIEAAAREASISQEATTRQTNDDLLGQLIAQESQDREQAISALQSATNQSLTKIDGNVTQLQNLFNQRYQTTTNLISNLSASFDTKVASLDALKQIILQNQSNISIIQGSETTAGSIAKALFDAKAYTDSKISDLIGGAPNILDTLKELADSIGDDGNFINTINNSIASEASTREQQVLALQEAIAALGGSVGNELSQAITSLQNSINAEISARQAADTATLNSANTHSDSNKQEILNLLSRSLIKKQKIIITTQHVTQGYVELPHVNIIPDSLNAFMDRLGIFEGEDFELSEVGNKTRLKFLNSFSAGGDEEIEVGSELRVKYWIV